MYTKRPKTVRFLRGTHLECFCVPHEFAREFDIVQLARRRVLLVGLEKPGQLCVVDHIRESVLPIRLKGNLLLVFKVNLQLFHGGIFLQTH
jgi:hypothetical protein